MTISEGESSSPNVLRLPLMKKSGEQSQPLSNSLKTTPPIESPLDGLSVLANLAQPQPPLVVEAFHLATFTGGKWHVYKVCSTNQLLFKLNDVIDYFYKSQSISIDSGKMDAFLRSQEQVTWEPLDGKSKPKVSVYFTSDGSIFLSSATLLKLSSEFDNTLLKQVSSMTRQELFKHDFSSMVSFESKSLSFAPSVVRLTPSNPMASTPAPSSATPPMLFGKRPHDDSKDRPSKARKLLSIDTQSPSVQNGSRHHVQSRPYPHPPNTAAVDSRKHQTPPAFIPGRPYQYNGPIPSIRPPNGPHPGQGQPGQPPSWFPPHHQQPPQQQHMRPPHPSHPSQMNGARGQHHHQTLVVPRHQGVEHLVSPRTEFPNRELPLPRGMDSKEFRPSPLHHSHAGSSVHSMPPGRPVNGGVPQTAHPLSHHQPPSHPGHPVPPPLSSASRSHGPQQGGNPASAGDGNPFFNLSRGQFLSLFDATYDQIEAVNRLQSTLQEQLRKSTTLLQTLSSSGQMIEDLVRTRFREMQTGYSEKFGAALTDLHHRISHLEKKMGITNEGPLDVPKSAESGPHSASTPTGKRLLHPPEALGSELLQRIEALETQLRREP